MSRKIVIIPSFASSHFLKCWIPNVIDSINPDIIIINEGLFPEGPENKGHIDDEFRKKWCHQNYSNCGFDYQPVHEWEDLLDIVEPYFIKENEFGFELLRPDLKILSRTIIYETKDVNECFKQSISTFYEFEPKPGDIIFPLEPDAFHHEKDKDKINELVRQLKPGEGLQTKWVDFLETQYYTEAINVTQPKWRRFAYCFDNMENYRSAMSGFMSQSYPKLKKVDDFITYHYPWFCYDKWKELRYELIYRSDPQYWKDFESGLQEIRNISERLKLNENYASHEPWNFDLTLSHEKHGKIVIRPTRSDEGRYAQFIDIEHPEAIKNHPNFVKC